MNNNGIATIETTTLLFKFVARLHERCSRIQTFYQTPFLNFTCHIHTNITHKIHTNNKNNITHQIHTKIAQWKKIKIFQQ